MRTPCIFQNRQLQNPNNNRRGYSVFFDRKGFNREVGLRLRALRQQRELTQSDLAAVLGVTRATHANMESGRQGMTLDVAWRLATFFRVPIDEITPEPADRRGSSPDDHTSGTIVETLFARQHPSHASTGVPIELDLNE